jgi:hypothetical protein
MNHAALRGFALGGVYGALTLYTMDHIEPQEHASMPYMQEDTELLDTYSQAVTTVVDTIGPHLTCVLTILEP